MRRALSIPRINLSLFALAALSMLSPGLAVAQQQDLFQDECFNESQIYEDIENTSYWLEWCVPQSLGCFKPTRPQLDTSFSDPTQAQTLVLTASKPGNYLAVKALWRAERYVPGGGFQTLWDVGTTDGIDETDSGPYAVEYGAPGLEEGSTYYFRVSYCNATKCTCWSDRSNPIQTAGSLTGGIPDPPQDTTQTIEDHFRRPATTASDQDGSGLGPEEVWSDYQAQIDGDEESAYIEQKHTNIGLASYQRESAHPHAYAEVLVRNVMTHASAYNFEVSARKYTEPGPTGDTLVYFVKLQKESTIGDGNPVLRFGRVKNRTTIDTPKTVTLDSLGCGTTTPLEQEDTESPGRSLPVWLRIEVDDLGAANDPTVTGTVAWGCSGSSCSTSCTASWTDTGDPEKMKEKPGTMGFSSHHLDYYVDIFRAGWETSP